MFTRIRWRLVGWNMLVLVVILALVGAAVYETLARSLAAEVDRSLATRGDSLLPGLDDLDREHLRAGPEGYSGGVFFLLVGNDGEILANPQRVDLGDLGAQLGVDQASGFATATVNGEATRLYNRPLRLRRLPPMTLIVGQSLVPEQAALRELLLVLMASGAVGLLLSLVGAWFLAGRALVPIETAFRRQLEFVAEASHELRTPLTVLHAAADLLDRHRAEPLEANGELFDDLRQGIARLERLAGDLLTLARSDLGELRLAVAEVDPAALATEMVRYTSPLAQERGIVLLLEPVEGPLAVEADPDRLQQVLLILLDNALKHSRTGSSVRVRVKRGGSEAVVEVVDSGEGIAPEHLPRIFDRFYRADRARSEEDGGAGLGLAIAKMLVEAHGGQLALSSAPEIGTTATVRIPLMGQTPSLVERLEHLAARVAHRPVEE